MSTYYINTKTNARSALAKSLSDNTRQTLPTYFLGDVLPIKLYFTDGAGAYADWSGETDLAVKVAVGNLSDGTVYAIADDFTYSNDCYSDSFVFSTEALATAMSGLESMTLTFEVEVARSNDDTITVYQNSVEVRNQLISPTTGDSSSGGSSGSVTLPDYIWVTDSSSSDYLLYKDTDTLYNDYDLMYEVDQSTDNTSDGSLGWQYTSGGGSAIDYYLDGISTQSIEGTMNGGTTIEEYEKTPSNINVDTSMWDSAYPTNLDGDYTYDSAETKYTQDSGNGGEIIREVDGSSYNWVIIDTNNSNYEWDRYNRTEAEHQFVETQPNSSESSMQSYATITKV